MERKAFIKYVCALLLFGMNGIVASRIALSSYEVVLTRTLIGSLLLLALFLIGKIRFHIREFRQDALFVALSGAAMGTSWMFLYEAYAQIGVSTASLLYYSGPVFVMVLSPLLFKERLTAPKVRGFSLSLSALCWSMGKRHSPAEISGVLSAGCFLPSPIASWSF